MPDPDLAAVAAKYGGKPAAPPGGDLGAIAAKYGGKAAAPNAGLAPPAGGPASQPMPAPGAINRFATAAGAATANLIPTRESLSHLMNDKPAHGEGDDSILPEAVSRAGRGVYESTINSPANRANSGDIAGGIGEFIPNALALKGALEPAAEAVPLRQIGRTAGTVGAGLGKIADVATFDRAGQIVDAVRGIKRGLQGKTEAPAPIARPSVGPPTLRTSTRIAKPEPEPEVTPPPIRSNTRPIPTEAPPNTSVPPVRFSTQRTGPIETAPPTETPPPASGDPILDRLRTNAAKIARNGHGNEPVPAEEPTPTTVNQDLTPALKKSLAKVRAAKRLSRPSEAK